MLGRRFLIIVAVLMGLTALAASLAPRDPALRSDATPTPTATATPEGAAEVPSGTGTVARMIDADDDAPQRVVVTQGEILELQVSSSDIDSVQLLDEIEPVDPDSNARFNLYADRAGEHDVTLLDADRVVGTVEIRDAN
jgi:hypothetical protein